MKNLKGIITVIFIVIALLAGVYLSQKTIFFSPKATSSYQNYQLKTDVPEIKDVAGLDNQIRELNQINIDQMDRALEENQNDINYSLQN